MVNWRLVAQVDWSRAASRHLQSSGSLSQNRFLVIACIAIGLFWLALYLWDKHRKHLLRTGTTPKALFFELCRAHRLNRAESATLWQAAQVKHGTQPALIFVDATALARLADGKSEEAGAATQLARKLFGER